MSTGLGCPFTTCQVDELQLGYDGVVHRCVISNLEIESEDAVRPARSMVQVVGGHHLVLDTFVIVLQAMLCIVALENEKVFNLELIILAPTDSKTILLSIVAFLDFGCV